MKDVSITVLRNLWLLAACLLSSSLLGQDSITSTEQYFDSNFVASVDHWILNSTPATPAAQEQDSLLLRKLWLTIIGLAPTLEEMNQYLSDADPNRYHRMVDHLLSRPEFAEHWAEKLDVMLMERRANTHIPQEQWSAWLRSQIAANRPLNHLLADLLVADGAPGEGRASARFLLDRTGDPNLITNDVARIYFGRDIQCSQCHNHPSIDSYRQSDYQGLFGFVSGIHLAEVADGDKKVQMVAEKSATDSPFESVFQRGTMYRVLPHLFGGDEFVQPWSIPGEEYHPIETGRPARPIHSRRQQLADAIRMGNLDAFNRNLANRLWSMVLGRGIVEPVDLNHSENPPLSQELLDTLSTQLATIRFDLRSFVRDLVHTKSFQRGRFETDDVSRSAPNWLVTALQNHAERMQLAEQQSTTARDQRAAAELEYNNALDASATLLKERLTSLGNVDTARASLSQAVEAAKKANSEKSTAEQAHASAVDKLAKLQVAADSTAAALHAVGQDAELAAAVELLKNRKATIEPTVEPLQKVLADKSAAAQAALDASAKAKEALIAAHQVASEVDTRVREKIAANRQHRIVFEDATLRMTQAEAELHYHKTLNAWVESSNSIAQLQQSIVQNHQERNLIDISLAGLSSSMQVVEQKTLDVLASAASLVGQANVQKQMVESIATKLKRVTDTNSALAETAKILNSPETIAPARQTLSDATIALQNELGEAEKELKSATSAADARQSELAQLRESLSQIQQQLSVKEKFKGEHAQQLVELEEKLNAARAQQTSSLHSTTQLLASRFLSSRLRPLTPEQMGWTFLATTKVYKNYVEKHLAEIEKTNPATADQSQDLAFLAERRTNAVRKARAELQGNINHFVTLYGAGPGQPQSDFFATPDQALYANNGGSIFAWATASGENVTAKVVAATSESEAADRLYLGVLSRKPTPAETSAVEHYLGQQPEIRARLAQELVWSLMASAEFRFLP